jgi:signal transduction histidine kinase
MQRRIEAGLLAVWITLFVALSLWTAGLMTSMVGQATPGFFVQPLLYVSPYQPPTWQVAATGLTSVDHVRAVDNRVVPTAQALLDRARAVPVGTPQRVEVTHAGVDRAVYVPTRVFTWADWLDAYGLFLALAWEFAVIGMAVWWMRPEHAGARALAVALSLMGLTILLYPDFNTTRALGTAWKSCYFLMGSAFMALALVFPSRTQPVARAPWLIALVWGAGALLAAAVSAMPERGIGAMPEDSYALIFAAHVFGNVWMALGFLMLVGSITWHLLRSPKGSLPRRQAGIALAGGLFGLLPLVAWATQYAFGLPMWVSVEAAIAWTACLPAAIAVAIVKAHLFDIHLVIRRSVTYLTLSALLGALYVLVATAMRLMHLGHAADPDLVSDLVVTALVVALAVPVRDMVQRFIDRRLFQAAYDAEQALEEASASMTALLDRDSIVERLKATLEATLRPAAGTVLLAEEDDRAYLPHAGWGEPAFAALGDDHPLLAELAAGAPVAATANSAPLDTRVSAALGAIGAELAVPITIQGRVIGVLLLGRKRADTAYTARDLRLLKTLANQSAIALENARSVRRLQAFNQSLEASVKERTQAAESALAELKAAQAQLVHAEKMAALGLLVGGVAHELNNPLTCITGGMELLEERLADMRRLLAAVEEGVDAATLAAMKAEADLAALPRELEVLMAACREGAERAGAIVQNLRDFSRQDTFEMQPVDLAGCLRSTVALVRSAYKERVTFELDLADETPRVQGSAGHLNQVFMNLIVNACQAIEGEGTVAVTLAPDDAGVAVTIADTGPGIPESVRERIFDPFYTTKPAGQGTGLGLAICLGLVEKHGGRIAVESRPGDGTRFTLCFPAIEERTPGHAHHSHRG